MSIAEMKLAAIQEIGKLNDERALKEILEYLSQLPGQEEETELNLSQHYTQAKAQYGDVLSKLAR